MGAASVAAALLPEFHKISDIIGATKRKCVAESTLNVKIGGIGISQRWQMILDQLCKEGALHCTYCNGSRFYRLVVDGKVQGVLPPRVREAEQAQGREIDGGNDQDDLEDQASISFEQVRAAQMWEARMGDQRWRDDPRALAERMRQTHLLPPFSNLPVREL